MRVSFWIPANLSWDETLAAGRTAVSLGCSGLWIADHFMPMAAKPADGPTHEAFTLMAALAATVPDVRIGSMVTGNTYRNPAVLAKQAVTIDHISGGRFILGMGAGWQENEHDAYGIDFETFKWRFDRLEEALTVIRSLTTESRTTFHGQHYTLNDAPLDPKPVNGRLPIIIGGKGPNRSLPIVAKFGDAWNMWGTPAMMAETGAVLDQRCEAIGRDPKSIERTAAALVFATRDETTLAKLRATDTGRPTLIGNPEQLTEELAAFEKAGVDELVVAGFTHRSAQDRADTLGLIIEALRGL